MKKNLLSCTALTGFVFLALGASPALANCDNLTPGNGATVTCDVAGGTETSKISGDGSTGVTVNVNAGAQVDVTGDRAIELNSGDVTVNAGAVVNSSNNNAIHFNTGSSSVTVAGTVSSGTTNAIDFGASDATLVLVDGYSLATAVAKGGTGDTLFLSGTSLNGTFDASRIGTTYTGFDQLTKAGSGTWTLTGSGLTNWTNLDGTLVGTTANLGDIANTGTLVIDQAGAGTMAGAVSGTGGLVKRGAGMVTLTQNNSYSGGTIVEGGGLNVSADNNLGNAAGDVTLNNSTLQYGAGFSIGIGRDFTLQNNATVDTNGFSSAISGNIGGTGALVKTGTGTLTLAGNSTYSGGTTVSGGTLQGTTDNLVGNIVNNANVSFTQSTTGTYAGDMSGTGSLTKTGSGTVYLTGTNTYTGGTNINAGSLQGTASGLQGAIVNNATLVFDDNADNTSNSDISGTGAVIKQGTGNTTLSGTNSYSGGTTISAGTLTGTTNSIQGNIVDNGTLALVQGFDGTFAGDISGSGNFIKGGAGNVTLTGTNTYSGTTTISAGTLTGTTANILGNVTNNGTLAFNQASDGTFNGDISGTGALTKLDAGIVVLNGTNTYSGGTTVSAGTLVGSATSIQGNIVNNAAVQIGEGATGTYAGDMSGTGSFLKGGIGNLILSGTNTYSGGTTVSAGTLTGTTTSLQGNVTNNAAVVLDQATAGTYAGDMSGSGSLTKSGIGTVTLSGTNSYSGGTTVSAGTLAGTTTSLQGNVANNAAVLLDQATAGTYAGDMSGTGTLTKSGAGNVTLSGTNSYSGGTTVSAGTLTGTTTSLQGNVANNAAVVLDQATAGTYAGDMSGTGTLTKSGAGNVTLSGTNTYSGGTTISAGTLTGTTANINGNVTNNGTLAIDQASAGTFSGDISGSGAFVKAGAGNVTLSGTNTYTGGTTISAGTLTGNATSLQGNIVDNGTVAFDQTTDATYAGDVSGTGSFIKTGAGNLTLTGTNTHSGGTTISTGTLTGDTDSLHGNIANNAALVFDQATTGSHTGDITGTGSLTKSGVGNVTLSGTNTYTGGTTISAGTLTGDTISLQGDIVDNGVLAFNQTTSGTYAGNISGTGSLVKTGAGNLTLGGSGVNAYSGGTTVSAGTLSGTTRNIQGNIVNNAAVVLGFDAGPNSYTGDMSGTGSFTIDSNNTILLSGTNTHTGGTTVTGGGTVSIGDVNDLGATSGAVTVDNATIQFNTGFTDAHDFIIGSGDAIFNTNGLSAALSGTVSGDALTKTGAGTLTLSGTNTYTGGNTISAGTLAGNVDSIKGNVANNGILALNQTTDASFTGNITGTGGLEKSGAGNLTLTGANTFSGNSTISAGTLTAEANALGSGNITNNAALVFAQTTADNFDGNITGTGTLTKNGAGDLTLNGTNSYSGGTTVAAGTLTGDTDSLQGNIVNNAAVTFAQAGAGTYAGDMSGTGALTKNGAGNLTLSGTSTYTGGTTISAGTLTGNATSLQGNIVDNGTVAFDQTTDATYAGDVSGTGSFIKTGAGNLTLTGTNTHSGGTTISTGTLTGDTDSIQGAVVNNAALVINQSVDANLVSNISGTGSFVKLGTGNVTMTGTNTYTGGTTVSTGTLTGNATSLDGNIVNNAILAFNQTGTGTYDNNISGTGSFVKLGAGNLTLLGTNTYSGGTTVSAGTVTGNSASLQGNIVNNAAVDFQQNSTGTYAGDISGTGSFTKSGSSTLTLTGTNTYSGGTTVSSGRLVGDTDALAGNIANNGIVEFAQGTSSTYAGTMTGAGVLEKSGAGTLTISGTNSYSGGTTVSGGAISVSSDANLGDANGDLTLAGSTLIFGNSFTMARDILLATGGGTINTNGQTAVADGNMTGIGSLTKTGAGTLSLTGTNSYSGGTSISAGTLAGNSASLQGAIVNNAALVFDQTATGTYGGVISGTGSFVKQGSGMLTLSGNNTYTGTTAITTGTLSVNGSIAGSTTTVGAFTTLKGTGTVGNTIANGRIAPGNSIGQLNVSGNLTFNAGSDFEVEVDDTGASDRIVATGDIFITGGDVDVQAAAGNYAATNLYTILTGNSVTGTFDSVTTNFAFFDPTLVYSGTNVQLRLDRNDINFAEAAADDGQAGVATAVDALGSGNDLYDAFVGLSTGQARDALNALSGEANVSLMNAMNASIATVQNAVSNHMTGLSHSGDTGNMGALAMSQDPGTYSAALIEPQAGPIERNVRMWVQGIGSFGDSKAQGAAPEQNRSSAGGLMGVDIAMNNGGYYGMFGGYEYGETETDSQRASADVKNYHLGAYVTKPTEKGLQLSAGASVTHHDIQTTRYVLIPGFTAAPKGETTGRTVNGFAEISKTFQARDIAIEPFINASLSYSHMDGYIEKEGGAANLSADSVHSLTPATVLGLRLGKEIRMSEDSLVNLSAQLGWLHNYGALEDRANMRFASGTTTFESGGTPRERDAAIVGVGIDGRIKQDMNAYANYNGVLSADSKDHTFTAGLKWKLPAKSRKMAATPAPQMADVTPPAQERIPALSELPEIQAAQERIPALVEMSMAEMTMPEEAPVQTAMTEEAQLRQSQENVLKLMGAPALDTAGKTAYRLSPATSAAPSHAASASEFPELPPALPRIGK